MEPKLMTLLKKYGKSVSMPIQVRETTPYNENTQGTLEVGLYGSTVLVETFETRVEVKTITGQRSIPCTGYRLLKGVYSYDNDTGMSDTDFVQIMEVKSLFEAVKEIMAYMARESVEQYLEEVEKFGDEREVLK